jgi:hypothetical protein
MPILPTQNLAQACRIFLNLAYPDGATSIPAPKLPYLTIGDDSCVEDYLPPAKCALGICQDLSKTKAGISGFEFRLGSATFPHLKLRIQTMDFQQREVWVYSVNTHDHFHPPSQTLSADDAEGWRQLIKQNRALKRRIEDAFAAAGLLTPTSILKLDLTS